jgi:hypothetical protein
LYRVLQSSFHARALAINKAGVRGVGGGVVVGVLVARAKHKTTVCHRFLPPPYYFYF